MSLSESQIGLLGNPFKPEEHGFKNGNIYIRKSAIRARLDKVDPGWELTPPELVSVTSDIVVMRGGLTIAGVTRYDIGTDVIQRSKKDPQNPAKQIPLSDYDIAANTAKAYKSAVSAILSRCAVQFGVGEYLKDMTPKEKAENADYATLTIWLNKLPVYKPPPPPQPVQPPLGDADHAALDVLTKKHLGLSADAALDSLELPKWDDFLRMFPALDGGLKAIGSALADQKRAVIVHQSVTGKAKNDNLYLSLDFGFATVAIFEEAIRDAFATTEPITGWKELGKTLTFEPPLRVILGRNGKGYPTASFAEQMDADEAEEEAAPAAAPLS